MQAGEALGRTSMVLSMYGLSVVSASLIQVLSRTWVALGDTRTPMRVALSMVALNIVGNVVLVQTPLREAGIALSTAISSWGNAVFLAVALRRRLRRTPETASPPPAVGKSRGLIAGAVRAVLASGVMAGALLATRPLWPNTDGGSGSLAILGFLAVAVPGGALVYGLASWVLRAPELRGWRRRG